MEKEQSLIKEIIELRSVTWHHHSFDWRRQCSKADNTVQNDGFLSSGKPNCHEYSEEQTHDAIQSCNERLDNVRGTNPLVHYEVGPDEISHVISDWTGIPMGKMLQDESPSDLKLSEAKPNSKH